MKTSIKEPKEFQPVTIEVTFETKEELSALWHRLNLSKAQVSNDSDQMRCPAGKYYDTISEDKSMILWIQVNAILELLKED